MMTNQSQGFYGFATFLLSEFTGQPTDVKPPAVDEGTCWGHLGATYGWNSVAFFTPGNNISLSVGTNTETDEQAGPSDAYCIAYNRVRQIIARAEGRQKTPIEDCKYVADGYFGTCVCPNTRFICRHGHHGSECEISAFGTETYEECSSTCA